MFYLRAINDLCSSCFLSRECVYRGKSCTYWVKCRFMFWIIFCWAKYRDLQVMAYIITSFDYRRSNLIWLYAQIQKKYLRFFYTLNSSDILVVLTIHLLIYCIHIMYSPLTQEVYWTYIRRSENAKSIFWTSYVRSFNDLCTRGYCIWCYLDQYFVLEPLASQIEIKPV